MSTTFEIENAKTLRQAPDVLRIVIKASGYGGQTLMQFEREDIISCVLTLRGVETKLQDPDLQASSIEIEAYWPGSDADILALRGKDAVIKYRCGYGTNLSLERTFYTTFDENGISLQKHVLTIKGTDAVGLVSGENEGKYVEDPPYTPGGATKSYGYMKDLISLYEYEIGHRFLGMNDPSISGADEYVNIPDLQMAKADYYDLDKNIILIEPKSHRKLIAQMCNIFRSQPRFVFRDAGIPVIGWAPTGIDTWQASSGKQMKTWRLDYDNLTDVTYEYGNPVKMVKMDNPGIDIDVNETEYEPVTFDRAGSKIISFTDPVVLGYTEFVEGAYSINLTMLNPRTFVAKATKKTTGSGPSTMHMRYRTVRKRYEQDESSPNIDMGTLLNYGDTVSLDDFIGLHWLYGTRGGIAFMDNVITEALYQTLTDCNLQQPRWISFKWRGHPDMQPRDVILLTEKDGSRNYYEIDNLTLEHRDGGLVSQVKAIYKMPYGQYAGA